MDVPRLVGAAEDALRALSRPGCPPTPALALAEAAKRLFPGEPLAHGDEDALLESLRRVDAALHRTLVDAVCFDAGLAALPMEQLAQAACASSMFGVVFNQTTGRWRGEFKVGVSDWMVVVGEFATWEEAASAVDRATQAAYGFGANTCTVSKVVIKADWMYDDDGVVSELERLRLGTRERFA